MNKKIDVSKISNELRGRSLHFARPPLQSLPAEGVPDNEPFPNQALTPPQENLPEQVTNVSMETSKQVSSETSFQVNKETSKQVSKETKKQGNKKLKRYATYLPEESILAMQKIAFETRRRDYEVFQEAVEKYIKRNAN